MREKYIFLNLFYSMIRWLEITKKKIKNEKNSIEKIINTLNMSYFLIIY